MIWTLCWIEWNLHSTLIKYKVVKNNGNILAEMIYIPLWLNIKAPLTLSVDYICDVNLHSTLIKYKGARYLNSFDTQAYGFTFHSD